MNETNRADIAQAHNSSELYFNDLSESHNIWQTHYNPMIGINYQLKIAALVNTRFLEPLLLDSDNVPACNLEDLWDSESYERYGAVFWPDIQRTRPDHPAWAVTNHPCDRSEYEFESGQVLVNKGRLFYHLQLAAWFTTRPFWIASVLGDKDIFRFAWHVLKTKFGTLAKWVTSLGFMIEQEFLGYTTQKFCGHTFAQHHPDHSTLNGDQGSGVAFLHGGTLKTMIAPMLARLRKLNGGIYTHYKQVDASKLEDWSQIEYHVGVRFLHAGQYLNATSHYAPSELVGVDEDLDKDGTPIGEDGLEKLKLSEDDLGKLMGCVDFEAVEAKPVGDWGEDGKGWEQTFDRAGGYWMIEDGYRWS